MAIITPAGNLSDRVIDITSLSIGGGGGGGGTVPQSRRIDTVAPLTGGGDLSADRSLSLTMTGGGSFAVGSGRVIAASSPLLVNGGPSSTLANDINLSINAFDGNNPGYVNPNPAGPTGTAYLDDTGNFSSSTVSGVPANRTLTMVPPMTIDGLPSADLSANRTIDAGVFTTALKGFVPASGGDPTTFLAGDGVFKHPTFGSGFVTLQGSTPGTADVGNAHVNGVLIADTAIVAGSTKKSLNGGGNEQFYVKQSTSANQPVVASYFNGSQTAGFVFRAARGTESAPVNPVTNDELASFNVAPWQSTNYDQREFLSVTQRAAFLNHTPFDTDIYGRGSGTSDTPSFLHLGGNSLAGMGTLTPQSAFEVAVSFGLKPHVVTGGGTYTMTDADVPVQYIDATIGATTLVLPFAAGRAGRTIAICKVDETNIATIGTQAGQTINGGNAYAMFTRGQAIVVNSDGFNWWIVASNGFPTELVHGVDSATVVNTTTETIIAPWGFIGTNIFNGQSYEAYATGILSTNGNPSIDFRVYSAGGIALADTGTIECPDTVTNVAWKLKFESIMTVDSPPTGRILDASLKVKASDGVFTEYNMIGNFGNPSGGPIPSYFSVQWGVADALNSLTCTAAKSKTIQKVGVI